MNEIPIIVRTLCDEGFSAFITNFIHFRRPREIVLVKNFDSHFTPYQKYVMDGLSLKGWKFEVVNSEPGDEKTCYTVYRYLLEHSITKFFFVDDDVICPERGYDLLESLSRPRTIIAHSTWNLHLNDYAWEIKNAGTLMIPNPHPVLFNLDRIVDDPAFEDLNRTEGYRGGQFIFELILSRYVDEVIIVKAKDLSVHVMFPRKTSTWRNLSIGKEEDFDRMMRELIKKYNPNYRCEFLEVMKI